MNICENHRFIEKEYWYGKVLDHSEHLRPEQVRELLEEAGSYKDLTFKFYSDGSVVIIDNDSNQFVKPGDLTGACLDFYIRQRIRWIRCDLQHKQLMYA